MGLDFLNSKIWKKTWKNHLVSTCTRKVEISGRSLKGCDLPSQLIMRYHVRFTFQTQKPLLFLDFTQPTSTVIHHKQYDIHPGRFTWNLKIHPWKRKTIFQTIFFRFDVNLRGGMVVLRKLFCYLGPWWITLESLVTESKTPRPRRTSAEVEVESSCFSQRGQISSNLILKVQWLKSTWHSPHILVYIVPLLTYLLVSVPSILTLRYLIVHSSWGLSFFRMFVHKKNSSKFSFGYLFCPPCCYHSEGETIWPRTGTKWSIQVLLLISLYHQIHFFSHEILLIPSWLSYLNLILFFCPFHHPTHGTSFF